MSHCPPLPELSFPQLALPPALPGQEFLPGCSPIGGTGWGGGWVVPVYLATLRDSRTDARRQAGKEQGALPGGPLLLPHLHEEGNRLKVASR